MFLREALYLRERPINGSGLMENWLKFLLVDVAGIIIEYGRNTVDGDTVIAISAADSLLSYFLG